MRRLDAIPTLAADEKAALEPNLRLPPDELEEVFKALLEQSKQTKK
jgi:hypothetical protein